MSDPRIVTLLIPGVAPDQALRTNNRSSMNRQWEAGVTRKEIKRALGIYQSKPPDGLALQEEEPITWRVDMLVRIRFQRGPRGGGRLDNDGAAGAFKPWLDALTPGSRGFHSWTGMSFIRGDDVTCIRYSTYGVDLSPGDPYTYIKFTEVLDEHDTPAIE